MAVFLQLALGSFPPFFPVRGDDIRDEDFLDLFHGSSAIEALENEFN